MIPIKEYLQYYPLSRPSTYTGTLPTHWKPDVIVMEKLRGMRAVFWAEDNNFYSRDGNLLVGATEAFRKSGHLEACRIVARAVNAVFLDGELFCMDSNQADINSACKRNQPLSAKLFFFIFDYGSLKDTRTYMERVTDLMQLTENIYKLLVPVWRVCDALTDEIIADRLKAITDSGGEGLILRNPYPIMYPFGRNMDILKVKPVVSAEGIVTNYTMAKPGKHYGLIGSLEVWLEDGRICNVSGMTDAERVKITNDIENIINLRCTIEFTEETKYGRLHAARFVALRPTDE